MYTYNGSQWVQVAGGTEVTKTIPDEISYDNGILSLKGDDTTISSVTLPEPQDGADGQDGKSAYELALQENPNVGPLQQWLASLRGADGIDGTNGEDGEDGKSAFQIWKEENNTPNASVSEFLASLKESNFTSVAVQQLPDTDIDTNKIYCLPDSLNNTWTENIYDGANWITLATHSGDLSGVVDDITNLDDRVEAIEEQLSESTSRIITLPKLEIESGVYTKSRAFVTGDVGDTISENTTASYIANCSFSKYDVHDITSIYNTSTVVIRSYVASAVKYVAIFTDVDGIIITRVNNPSGNTTSNSIDIEVEVPSNAYYMYVNIYSNDINIVPRAGVLQSNSSVIDSLKNKVNSIQSQLNDESDGNIETTVTNGYILKRDGTLTSSGNYSVTDFIPVEYGYTYYYTGECDQPCVYGYDQDQNVVCFLARIGFNNSSTVYNHFAFTIPFDVSYIRACGLTASNFYLEGSVVVSKLAEINQQLEEIKDTLDNLPSGGGGDEPGGGESSQQIYKEVFREIPLSLNVGIYPNDSSTILSSQTGFACTDFIPVTPGTKIYVTCQRDNNRTVQGYKIVNGTYVFTEAILYAGSYYRQEATIGAETTHITINSSITVVPRLFTKEQVSLDVPTKKCIHKNVRFVGMSIWAYDNNVVSSIGRKRGYQTLLNEQFDFDNDSGALYCYSANSLAALSEDRNSDNGVGKSIALKLINNFNGVWTNLNNAIWTLDTIINDYGRGVALGTTSDYDNNTGADTYYGALRVFADKVVELSGNDAIVIVSNALRRTGGMPPIPATNGHTVEDFEQALIYAANKNGWYFVDQYRQGGVSENIVSLVTHDGIHLNNTGYKLAVLPWIAVFDQIYNKLLSDSKV